MSYKLSVVEHVKNFNSQKPAIKRSRYLAPLLVCLSLFSLGGTAGAETYNAMAVAWSKNNAWVVRERETEDRAITEALRFCRDNYGGCELGLSFSGSGYKCLALVLDANGRRFSSSRNSAESAANETMARCGNRTCEVRYVGCNN